MEYIMELAVIGAGLFLFMWLIDIRILYKSKRNGVGRHRADNIGLKVARDYHPNPDDIKCPGLWWARTTDQWKVRVGRFTQEHIYGNWNWVDLPISDWPEAWKIGSA